MKTFVSFLVLLCVVTGSFAQFNLVNSGYDEQNPVISPDGKTLYVTIANHPQNVGGIKDPGDIWMSVWVGNAWAAPVHGGTLLNSRGYNGCGRVEQKR
jgi:OOP family OmpA-OmpF porin